MHRVLVVEDHEPWRRYISSELEHAPEWQVVGEASDGIEAVQRAQELGPDLILLDIGLPGLNGVEAARRMLAQNTSARILFVSEQQSWDVAEAALCTGARGYIVKSDVAHDLKLAMEAIVEGKRFVSARFGGRVFEKATAARVTREMRRHEAGFYSDESSLLDAYCGFAEAALDAGSSLIVFVTNTRRDAIHERLQARGIDVDGAMKERRYHSVDLADALSTFVVDGRVDEARCWNAAHSLIMEAARASKSDHPRVAACGECAPTLLKEGMAHAAIRLEHLWDEVVRRYNLDLFCGYSTGDLCCDESSPVFQDIRSAHSAVHICDNGGLAEMTFQEGPAPPLGAKGTRT